MPSSYKSFLMTHGGKDQSILQGLKEVVNHTAFSNLEAIEKYYNSVGVDIKLDPNMKVPCSVSTTNLLIIVGVFLIYNMLCHMIASHSYSVVVPYQAFRYNILL